MATKSERTRVEITESSTSDVRTFSITLSVPLIEFQLTDLLKQRGVMGGLEVGLRTAIKGATESYIKAAETLISGLVSKPNGSRKTGRGDNDNGKTTDRISNV